MLDETLAGLGRARADHRRQSSRFHQANGQGPAASSWTSRRGLISRMRRRIESAAGAGLALSSKRNVRILSPREDRRILIEKSPQQLLGLVIQAHGVESQELLDSCLAEGLDPAPPFARAWLISPARTRWPSGSRRRRGIGTLALGLPGADSPRELGGAMAHLYPRRRMK